MAARMTLTGTLLTLTLLAIPLASCGKDGAGAGDEFKVYGASTSPPPAPPVLASPPGIVIGTPVTLVAGIYDVYLGSMADCSDATLIRSFGSTPIFRDFVTSPLLFTLRVTPGTYPCPALGMQDVLTFQSPVTSGPCTAGVDVQKDPYRAPDTDLLDMAGDPIPATGTTTTPGADHVYFLFSTDPASVTARGYSPNQVLQLSTPMIVPGQTTLYLDATNSVVDEGGFCSLVPGAYTFR